MAKKIKINPELMSVLAERIKEKKARYLYNNGLPFRDELALTLKAIIERVKGNKAGMIIIDGGIGEGKTTLAIHCADYINKQFNKPEIDLSDKEVPQYAVGGQEFTKKLRQCYLKEHPVLIYDESGDFNSRGALTGFNANLNRIFETYRTFHIIVILCLPRFFVLDNDLFNKDIPRYLIHCYGRTKDKGLYKVYSLYRTLWIKGHVKNPKVKVKSDAYGYEEPNFHGSFLDLPPKRCKQLDVLCTSKKLDIIQGQEIKMENIVDVREIARKMGRSVEWVYLVIAKLHLKPKSIIKCKNYYDRDVLDVFNNYLSSRKGYKG